MLICDLLIVDLGLSAFVILSALVQAVRYKSGTKPSTNLHRAFHFHPEAFHHLINSTIKELKIECNYLTLEFKYILMNYIKEQTVKNLAYFLTNEEITNKNGNNLKFFRDNSFSVNGVNCGTYKIDFPEKLSLYLQANDKFTFSDISERFGKRLLIESDTNQIDSILVLLSTL